MTTLEAEMLVGFMGMFVALCMAVTFYGCYLAWFDPDRLRGFEIKVAETFPSWKPLEDRVNEIRSGSWLILRRITTTAGSIAFVYVAITLVGALLTKR